MTEQQQKELENRISDALLEPLTDEQLQQMDQMLDNPAATEDSVEQFLRQVGVDVEGISQRITQDFIKEQGIQPVATPQPAVAPQPVATPQSVAAPQPIAPAPQPNMQQPVQPVQAAQQPAQPIQPTQPIQTQGAAL